MPAPKNNKFAAKPEDQKSSGSRIVINCNRYDKAKIVRFTQSNGDKLSPWALATLLEAIEMKPTTTALSPAEIANHQPEVSDVPPGPPDELPDITEGTLSAPVTGRSREKRVVQLTFASVADYDAFFETVVETDEDGMIIVQF